MSSAACIDSRSRISPIWMTSGAARIALFSARCVGLGIEPDLALIDDRHLVRMQELDRILDGNDVRRSFLVPMVDHGGEGRGFAAAGRADHQDQAAAQHDQILELVRHAEIFEGRQLGRDIAQDHGDVAALMEDVDAEPSEPGFGDGEIDLEFTRELLQLRLVHEFECRLLDHFRRHLQLVDGHDLAVDLDLGRRERREEEVRGFLLHHQFEQRLDVHLDAFVRDCQKVCAVSSSMILRLSDCWSAIDESRLLSSLTRRRSSFLESAFRIASS